jgi:hypothetical protein
MQPRAALDSVILWIWTFFVLEVAVIVRLVKTYNKQ